MFKRSTKVESSVAGVVVVAAAVVVVVISVVVNENTLSGGNNVLVHAESAQRCLVSHNLTVKKIVGRKKIAN